MIMMHGIFDLKDKVDEREFRESFDRLAEHLKDTGLVNQSRCMRHQEHDGYNSHEPLGRYYVSMEFPDMQCAEQCWDFIEGRSGSVGQLHAAVFSKICNWRFFLSSDI